MLDAFTLKPDNWTYSHSRLLPKNYYLLGRQCIPSSLLKFLFKVRTFWETHKIWKKYLTNQLIYSVNVKTMRKILSNYVCFSKSPNFKCYFCTACPWAYSWYIGSSARGRMANFPAFIVSKSFEHIPFGHSIPQIKTCFVAHFDVWKNIWRFWKSVFRYTRLMIYRVVIKRSHNFYLFWGQSIWSKNFQTCRFKRQL